MPELSDSLAGRYIPSKRLIYDGIDTGTEITLTADTEYLLPIDGLVYVYKTY